MGINIYLGKIYVYIRYRKGSFKCVYKGCDWIEIKICIKVKWR